MKYIIKEEEAYKEIIETLKKYKDIIVYDIRALEDKANNHLFGIELEKKYGLNLKAKDINSLSWNKFGDYLSIGLWGKKYNRTISWEDNGKQPDDELLLRISFPTGAYIFGNDYGVDFFKEFFLELKSYNPKYIDTVNCGLYFSMDNAGKIFNDFKCILDKYHVKNKEDAKRRKIIKIKKELKALEVSM
mgnify:FL=1